MAPIKKIKVTEGVYWVEIPEADMRILCGCPADSIKHLAIKGLLPKVEENGVRYESGPNAILLSDLLVQNGQLSNVSEFVAYHIFYTQGAIIPSHPNSKKPKPLLIGRKDQVDAQMEYIYRGNYGLTSEAEFIGCGETKRFARENLAMKLSFAYGSFSRTQDLIDGVYLERSRVELRNGVTVKRIRRNVFSIAYKGRPVQVDLNLRKRRHYQPSFKLKAVQVPDAYFSVIHTGEGDGWNPEKPSLSSVIQLEGRFYLIDAGPYIKKNLKCVGVNPSQLSGIFITHVHDDHIAGLFDLIHKERPLTIFATKVIRETIVLKMKALLSVDRQQMNRFFNFVDLDRSTWNMLSGLEVKPIPTAHPVDTTILVFRVRGKNRYYSYGHFSDIAALRWLESMVVARRTKGGISRQYFEAIKSDFGMELDLKKIDVGGPPIHGDANDFAQDRTKKKILGHAHARFTKEQLAIGREVKFGHCDVLIRKKP